MKNSVQTGNTLTVTAPYNLSSGDGCLVGQIFGVACEDALISTPVELDVCGVKDLKKTNNLAVAQGDLMYWNDTNRELTKTSSDTPVAVCVQTAVTASTVVRVALLRGYTAAVDQTLVKYATVSIAAAAVTGTSAGQLGHASGVVLVADPGAGKVVELISAVVSYTYSVAAYTAGGNITVNINGGSALTGVVSAANSLGASADKIVQFAPLAAAGNALTANKGLNLVAATAFTQPGTAAGTVKVFVAYRVHTL